MASKPKQKKNELAGVRIKSMTGFGKEAERSPYGQITVEIKTLNHKSLSITCNPFNGLFLLEEKLQDVIGKRIFRGKTFVRVTREDAGSKKNLKKIVVNENLAKEYVRNIKKVQKKLKLKGEVTINDLITFPGIVESSTEQESDKLWKYIEKAAAKAVSKLIEYRKSEGLRLAKDFNERLKKIANNIKKIEIYEKQAVVKYRQKLVKSIKEISGAAKPDKNRLEEEVALFARNCDIAEELTRLSGHIVAYKEAMKQVKTDAGKKLDFIAQEMQREANTIGAKSGDFRISQAIIDVKSEIEKIREQIKNIE